MAGMSLAVSPSLTPMLRSDAGTDPAARALQALVQMATNADAPLDALVKAVAANNLTTLSVNGETLQVRLSVALPVGTALSIAPVPGTPAAVTVQVKPQVPVAQLALDVSAQAAIVSALTAKNGQDAPSPAIPTRQPQPNLPAPAEDPSSAFSPVPPASTAAAKPMPQAEARAHVAAGIASTALDAQELAGAPTIRGPAVPGVPQVATEPVASTSVARDAAPVPTAPGPGQPARAPLSGGVTPISPLPITDGEPLVVPTPAPQAAPLPNATASGAKAFSLPTPAATPPPTAAGQAPPPATAPQAAAQNLGSPPLTATALAPTPAPPASASAPSAQTAPAEAADASGVPRTFVPEPARPAAIPYATAPRPSAAVAAPPPDLARAIATQQPLAPVLADAVKLAADPAMPPPLRVAAQQVVAQAIDPTRAPLDAATLKHAVESAGVLRPLSPLASPDLENRLTALRNVLASLLGDDAIALPNERRRAAAVPLRGDAPHAERSEMVPLADEAPRGLAHRLLAETDGALSRLKLLQAASLPADGRAPDPARPAEYRVEVPMLLGREATTIQFVFDREAQPHEQKKPRGWRMRFALNVAALGEVGADISILGAATQVTVWASETETAALIEQMLPDLAPALAARGLEPGAIRMRHGRPGSIATGRLVDSNR
jgi:hypothetical protein